MFRRDPAVEIGEYMRHGLEPMARRLGLDYDRAFYEPPTSDERRALDAFRCGQSLLMSFTDADGWPTAGGYRRLAKLGRKAARVFRASLPTERGANAISHMTQGYAREIAATWRRAAISRGAEEATALRENAERSEQLGRLAGSFLPVPR